jgi:outer membrane protein
MAMLTLFLRLFIIALVWVTVPIAPLAAQQTTLKIGYVDMRQLLDQAPQITLSREAIDREFRPRNDAIAADEQRLQGLTRQLQSAGGDSLVLQNQIRDLQLSINRRREDLRQEILFRRNEAIQSLEDDINTAVAAVATQQDYDLILSSPVIYANDRIDLTSLVLEKLKQQARLDGLD